MDSAPENSLESEVARMYSEVLAKDISLFKKYILLNEIRKLRPAGQNRWNIRWIIFALALVAVSSPLAYGAAILCGTAGSAGEIVPDAMLSLSSAAVGALAAYFASLRQD